MVYSQYISYHITIAAIGQMTEKESAHDNFADFSGVDQSEPMDNADAYVASASTPISDMVSVLSHS